MNSKKCSLWNKQSLCLSFCLVSVCFLPTSVEAIALGDHGQNAPQNPSYSSNRSPSSTFSYRNDFSPVNSLGVSEEASSSTDILPSAPEARSLNDQNTRVYRGFGGTSSSSQEIKQEVAPTNFDGWYGKNQGNLFYQNAPSNEWTTGNATQSANDAEYQDNDADNQYATVDQADQFESRFRSSEASYEDQADDTYGVAEQTHSDLSYQAAGDAPLAENSVNLSWDEHRSQEYSWDTSCTQAATVCCAPRKTCCWGDFRVFADLLYWNFCQDNVEYAAHARDISGPAVDPAISMPSAWFSGDYHIKSVSSKYKPGFRVGGFYSSPCCNGFDFGVVYTQLHSQYRNNACAHCDTDLILPTQLPNLGDAAELLFRNVLEEQSPVACSNFRLHYDMLDFLVTTSYCNGGCFSLQPYFGARFLEIKERWNVDYLFTATDSSLPVLDVTATNRWKSKIPAGGITAGVSAAYTFCGCWSVIGRLGASCVGGRVKQRTRLDADFTVGDLSSSLLPARVSKKKCSVLTGFEGALGLAYNVNIWKCGMQFAVGYEFQNWYNVPSPIEHGIVVPGIRRNPSVNLSLHGLFVRAGISF